MGREYPLDQDMIDVIARQRDAYRATDGRVGATIPTEDGRELEIIVLTTIGRRSGEERHVPLVFGRDGEHFVIVGSLGGYDKPPSWYLNLTANADVQVQYKAERFAARARTADPDERDQLWPMMAELYPEYEAYQAATERVIPVVVLERR
jgi:deazaflavin-dependent oxidoreductase (nitroreductase family)